MIGTLYHHPIARSNKIVWLITELGLKANIKVVNIFAGEQKKPEFLKINPRGQVPTFEDADGYVLFESNAILLHLLDKYDKDGKFGGRHGSEQRAHLYKWCVWTATADKVCSDALLNGFVFPEPQRDKQIYADAVKKWNDGVGEALVRELADKKFFWSDQFTAVDIPITHMVRLGSNAKLLEDNRFKPLKDYLQRVGQIESFKKCYEQQN